MVRYISSSPPALFLRPKVLAIATLGLCASTDTAAHPNAGFLASGFTGVISVQAPDLVSSFHTPPSVMPLGPGDVP